MVSPILNSIPKEFLSEFIDNIQTRKVSNNIN